MSKNRKKRQKATSSAAKGEVRKANIPSAADIRVPDIVDATGLHAIVTNVNDLQDQVAQFRSTPTVKQIEVVPPAVISAFTQIATNAWRARGKMLAPDTDEPKEEMKRVYRHIEAIFEAFEHLGVQTLDPAGRAYDSGMALKVVSFEQTPGISREEITETIKPSIVWQGRLLQMGEVIVGTPQTDVASQKGEQNEKNND